MAETESAYSAKSTFQSDANSLCDSIRQAFGHAANAFLPPEEARRHFRQARVEVLKGIRELIDRRISHLNRDDTKGTRVVVE